MAAYTRLGKGDLHLLQIVKESTYGTTPDSGAVVLGVMTSFKPSPTDETFEVPVQRTSSGARTSKGKTLIKARDESFTVKYYIDDIATFLAFLKDSSSGESYTMTAEVKYKTAYVYTGCTVETGNLTAGGYGAPFECEMTVKAKTCAKNQPLASDITTSNLPYRSNAVWDCSVNDLDASLKVASSWTLTWSNNLQCIAGAYTGQPFASANGESPILGELEVRLSVTSPALYDAVGDTYRGASASASSAEYKTMNLSLILVASKKIITVQGAYLDNDYATRTTEEYDEPFTFVASTLSVTNTS